MIVYWKTASGLLHYCLGFLTVAFRYQGLQLNLILKDKVSCCILFDFYTLTGHIFSFICALIYCIPLTLKIWAVLRKDVSDSWKTDTSP